jgi:type IV secretion system protein VirD4
MSVWRLVCGSLFLLLGGLIAWTQYLAYHYGYHAALGTPLWTAQHFYHRYGVYWPWQALVWQWRWGGVWWQVGLAGGSLGLGIGVALTVWLVGRHRHRQPPAMTGHGAARWATTRDIRKAGLL